jgi:AraC-like DNA-binding protein
MNPVRFTTEALPARDQFDAWRGWFDGVFDVEAEDSAAGFVATSTIWTFDEFALSRVKAPALTAIRDTALLRANPIDHWSVTLGRSRTRGMAGEGLPLDVPPCVPFVASLGSPLVSRRPADERLQLYLPRDGFRELAPLLDAALGQPLDTPMGRLLGDYLGLLERSLPDIEPADAPRLTNAVRAMVLACLGAAADSPEAAGGQISLTRREKARGFIEGHLRNPRLDAAMLCREIGMSRTQLYRLFQDDGGIARYVRQRRLMRAYADLADQSSAASITLIAASLCFEDASSFSRAFKQEFGLNPRDVRAAAAAGLSLPSRPRAAGSGMRAENPATLRECLMRF